MSESQSLSGQQSKEKLILISSIFVAGLCSIIYELLISTTSSYFLGDSIKQFSITIGVYMASMGLGSFLSRIFQRDLILRFIEVEILLGLIGGSSVPILYFVFSDLNYVAFQLSMIGLIIIIGILTGLEIPLLARIMKEYYPLKINLSNVLSMDYFGALAATLLFPFILLPWIGVFLSSLVFGIVNIGIGFLNLWFFRSFIASAKRIRYLLSAAFVTLFFVLLAIFSQQLLQEWHDRLYRDRIVYTKTTPYQTLVLTKANDDLRLFINRVIQFSSTDEYRYHESLVHLAFAKSDYRKNVLILGGGEALTAREVLKYPDVEQVTIVDIDPEMFRLAKEHPAIQEINNNSMADPRVIPVPEDAFVFLQQHPALYDVIIADLPDPTNESLARLYSREFFKLVKKRLVPGGVFVTQAGSPFHTTKAFWCIESSIQAADFEHTYPYHAYVPSFGDWGFIMASDRALDTTQFKLETENRYLSAETIPHLFHFEKDMRLDTVPHSTLDRPFLLDFYLEEWRRWARLNVERQ
ncbi:MAG: polyamine aminopropyltransferase [Saprospiraceae bacterium]|nr:polyamine aminopropyltransferase [Saprospiraceae bacterium]